MSDLITRSAVFEPSSYNPEKRTVGVIFSTGAPVMRSDWEGPFEERLSMDPAAVDLSKLIGGPVLDSHDRFSGVRSILGIVETAAVDGKRVMGPEAKRQPGGIPWKFRFFHWRPMPGRIHEVKR